MSNRFGLFIAFVLSLALFFWGFCPCEGSITQWNSVTEDTSDSFSGDITIDESREVEFSVSSPDSYEWIWSVNEGETKESEGKSSNLVYAFEDYGTYNVSVVGMRENETECACWNVTVWLVIGEENDVRELEGLADYTLRISKVPERIVSMAPSCTEILFAVGAGDRVVGITEYCDYPPEVEEKKEKGEIEVIGGYSTPSIEKIVDFEPDLIVGAHGNTDDVIFRLIELGYPVYAMHPKNIEEIFSHIKVTGALTKCDETASSLLNELREKLDEIEEKTELLEEGQRPRVFYNIGDFFTAGEGTFISEIIETAGGKNIAADKSGYFIMNLEELMDKNPQVILCDSGHGGMSSAYDQIMSEERLKILDAVKNKRVYLIDGDIMDRPGPRIVNATETVYGYLYGFFGIIEEEEAPSPTITPTASQTSTPTPIITATPTPTASVPSSSSQTPGFEAMSTVIGILIGIVFIKTRKQNIVRR